MEELTFRDMIAILLRRKKYFFFAATVVFCIAMIFVMRWSNYRSTATVQIEQSYIASNLTDADEMVATLVDQRISQIEQKVTGLESLSEIINKFNLYADERSNMPLAAITGKMRERIQVNLVSGTISNPVAAQKQTAEQLSAIAFHVSFDYTDPQIAQQVTDELVTRFLDEDLKQRRLQAQETSDFLNVQLGALEENMVLQEKAIAEFRSKYGESGPNALMFNQQTAANVGLAIQTAQRQIMTNEGSQGIVKGQLAGMDPYSRVIADGQIMTTPSIQLKALKSEYASLTGRYGPNHPDVVKLRRQIASLRAEVGPESSTAQLEAQLDDVRTHLSAARSTKSDDHPDVIGLQSKLDKLEADLKSETKNSTSDSIIVKDADNPTYLQLAAQLRTLEQQHESLEEQLESLEEQKTKYEKMIAANPGIEQDMARLTRNYENAQLRYRELREKKMVADMNVQLELGRKGQKLMVINPPAIPDYTQPKRKLLALGALILAVMAGISSVVAAEALNQGVYGESHVTHLLGAPPLVIIPYMYMENEKRHVSQLKPYVRILKLGINIVRQFAKNLLSSKTKRSKGA